MTLTKKERQSLFEKFGGKCTYCGCELTKGWHVDHIEPVIRSKKFLGRDAFGIKIYQNYLENPEAERVENLFPACASCNILKNSHSLEQFRSIIEQFITSLNRYSTQYKFAKKYGLVRETDARVTFYFETITNTL